MMTNMLTAKCKANDMQVAEICWDNKNNCYAIRNNLSGDIQRFDSRDQMKKEWELLIKSFGYYFEVVTC